MSLNQPSPHQSPFETLEQERNRKLLLLILNALAPMAVPIQIPIFLMLFTNLAWQTLVVFTISVGVVPLALWSRHRARQGEYHLGALFLTVYFPTMVTINGILIGGVFEAVAPTLAAFVIIAGMVLGMRGAHIVGTFMALLWGVGWLITSQDWVAPISVNPTIHNIFVAAIIVSDFSLIAVLSQLAVTDLHRALRDATFDLVRANRQLEEANRLKSQFTARTSHELRTPLSAIIVFTDMTLREVYGPLTEQQFDGLQRVLVNARRLSGLINDILDISKMEANELEIVEAPFAIINLVDSVRASTESAAQEKGLKFGITVSPAIPAELMGDEKRLSQILINLTNNAIKFTPIGEVSVRLEPAPDHHWQIVVRDTGRGIQRPDKIFEEFYQEETAAADPKLKGTGLGLAITRQLAEAMQGTVQVQSKLGKGSTFTVTLPLQLPPVTASPPALVTAVPEVAGA